MSLITEKASYRGVLLEHAVGATKSGLPQFIAKLRGLERYDAEEKVWVGWEAREDCEITAYLVLFDKKGDPIFHAKDIQKVFEWDGASLVGLEVLELEGAEVQFEVVEHTYEGKTSLQVAGIRGYNEEPGNSVRKLDVDELAQLNAKFGNSLKKLSGGPKAASAKTGKTATATAAAAAAFNAANAASIAAAKAKDKNNPPASTATAKRGKSTATKKTTAPPPPPAAPTEADAVAEATKPVPEPVAESKLPVGEAVKEFNKPAAQDAQAPPMPAPPTVVPTTVAGATADVRTLTYEEAWAECCNKRAKTVTDTQLATAFTAAMHRQAPGKTEKEISDTDWVLIADAVVGECG